MEIEKIEESIMNGQFKQAKKQILKYGQKNYINDVLEYYYDSDINNNEQLYHIKKSIKVAIN